MWAIYKGNTVQQRRKAYSMLHAIVQSMNYMVNFGEFAARRAIIIQKDDGTELRFEEVAQTVGGIDQQFPRYREAYHAARQEGLDNEAAHDYAADLIA
jgi:hypothetical protein